MKKIFPILIVFFLLTSLVFAVDPWLTIFPGGPDYGTIALLIGVVLLLATALTVVVWMVANVLNNEGIKAYAKMELFEIAYSGFLFVLLFSLFPMFDGVMDTVMPVLYKNYGPKVDYLAQYGHSGYDLLPVHFRYAKFFLSYLFNEAVMFSETLLSTYSFTGPMGDLYISLDLFWEQRSSINYNPLRGFFHMGNVIKLQVFDLVTKVALITKFQELLLHVFISGFFPAFLGIGIILRSFSITRRLGGLMMGLALGLYFIFPLSYIFAGAIHDHVGGVGTFNTNYNEIAEQMKNPFSGLGVGTDESKITTADPSAAEYTSGSFAEKLKELEDQIGGDASKQDLCKLFVSTSEDNEDNFNELSGSVGAWLDIFQENSMDVSLVDDAYFDIPARLIFFSMFFSFWGLMMTIAGVRSFSVTFGGDLEIAGLTHLI